jgi:hypothetical protein
MQNIGWADVVIGPYMGANGNLKHLDKLGIGVLLEMVKYLLCFLEFCGRMVKKQM